jgi:hypothetical protein
MKGVILYFSTKYTGQASEINLYFPFKPKRVETESTFFYIYRDYSYIIHILV